MRKLSKSSKKAAKRSYVSGQVTNASGPRIGVRQLKSTTSVSTSTSKNSGTQTELEKLGYRDMARHEKIVLTELINQMLDCTGRVQAKLEQLEINAVTGETYFNRCKKQVKGYFMSFVTCVIKTIINVLSKSLLLLRPVEPAPAKASRMFVAQGSLSYSDTDTYSDTD